MSPSPWRAQAACRGLPSEEADRLFFPAKGIHPKEAREMCMTCPVRAECDTAGAAEQGMWGGLTWRDRIEQQCEGCGRVLNGSRFRAASPLTNCLNRLCYECEGDVRRRRRQREAA